MQEVSEENSTPVFVCSRQHIDPNKEVDATKKDVFVSVDGQAVLFATVENNMSFDDFDLGEGLVSHAIKCRGEAIQMFVAYQTDLWDTAVASYEDESGLFEIGLWIWEGEVLGVSETLAEGSVEKTLYVYIDERARIAGSFRRASLDDLHEFGVRLAEGTSGTSNRRMIRKTRR